MTSNAPTMSIPPRVRRAALGVVDDWTVKPEAIVGELGQRGGFTTVGELEKTCSPSGSGLRRSRPSGRC